MAAGFAKVVKRLLPGVLQTFCKVSNHGSRAFRSLDLVRTMASGHKVDLSGVFPPIVTPFDAQENIDYDKLSKNIGRWNTMPLKGYVVHGSNGEYVFLTKEERVEMIRKVRQETPKDKLVVAGSGCESTRDTIEMSKMMSAAGADALLVITPCYFKGLMTSEALIKHYTQVADQSPAPIILYSVPKNTGIDLPIEVAVSLSKHPNIIGMKDSGGDVAKIGVIVHKTQENHFQVLAGSAGFFLGSLSVGAVGTVSALANVLGGEMCQLHDLFKTGRLDDAMKLQHRLIEPNSAVTAKFGVPGLKVAMEWFGFYGGPVRSPLQPASDVQKAQLRQTFVENGFM